MFEFGKDRGCTTPMPPLSGKKSRQKHVRNKTVGTSFSGRRGFALQGSDTLGRGAYGGNRPVEMD